MNKIKLIMGALQKKIDAESINVKETPDGFEFIAKGKFGSIFFEARNNILENEPSKLVDILVGLYKKAAAEKIFVSTKPALIGYSAVAEASLVCEHQLDLLKVYMYKLDNGVAFALSLEDMTNLNLEDFIGVFKHEWNKHVPKKYSIEKLNEVCMNLLGQESDSSYLMGLFDFDSEWYVVQKLDNNDKSFGAIAMCNNTLLAKIADHFNVDEIIIVPSSIHEIIVVPKIAEITELFCPNVLSAMISDINRSCVDARDVLSNHAYVYNKNTDSVTNYM